MIHNDPAEFDQIYQQGGWDDKGSGPGSTELFTRRFREVFQNLLVERNIRSVFDMGCGDWRWQRYVDWGEIIYTGWDVSSHAIRDVKLRIAESGRKATYAIARTLDAFDQPLWPEHDLLLVKDVVHHISPYRVRMLIERAKYYNYVLWVVDYGENSVGDMYPCNWHGEFPVNWPLIYAFDRSVDNYRYGPKAAFLQVNP